MHPNMIKGISCSYRSSFVEALLLLFKVFYLLAIITFNLCNAESDVSCLETERQSLLEFKNGLKDPANTLSSWVDRDCCRWEGVSCDKTGHVVKLILRNHNYIKQGLSGEIRPSLTNLSHLVYFDLGLNNFRGSRVPPFMGSMKRLRYLDLGGAGFGGTIRQQLGNLSNLQFLDLHSGVSTQMKSHDLQWLSGLSSLKYLDLGNNDLSRVGEDWVDVINKLPSLSYLSLSSCFLQDIPSSLPSVNLTSLVNLDISSNNFSSTVPNWLFNLTTLVSLSLKVNRFHGYLPDGVVRLTNLSTLDLSNNSFHGPIPTSLANLASLERLYLSWNQLNGSIPSALGRLSKLADLFLDYNSFEGVLSEAHFSDLRSLKKFTILSNYLSLEVGSDWVPPFQLIYLGLGYCNLGPRFPPWLRTQKKLKYLDLRNTSISENIPVWFGEITPHLKRLKLDHNQIHGQVPSSLEFAYRAKVDLSSNRLEGLFPFPSMNFGLLDLADNQFSGAIPWNIGHIMPNLSYLSLASNNFSGSIPVSLGNLQQLRAIILSRNQLTGNIPSGLVNCSSLEVLDLENNYLSGEIPSSIGQLMGLRTIHLNHNGLSGQLPQSLRNCSKLVTLDLGENQFQGNIPSWIGERLSSLKILRLRSNNFNGTVPPQLSFLASLQVLDLADNNLTGPIPWSFNNLTAMAEVQKTYQDLADHFVIYGSLTYYEENVEVVKKWRLLEYTTTLSLVAAIDLSGNNLSGEIPKSLMELVGLQVLNLSWNHLTGTIPNNIGSLSRLESIDFSNNLLSGVIAPSITDLTFLVALNLSNNNLSGTIPRGNQLQTLDDPSMYHGNPLLSGYPLLKSCPEEKPSTTPRVVGSDKDENSLDDKWFYATIGFGYSTGILGFCTILLIKKSWSYVYFQFLDEVIARIPGIGRIV